MQLKPYSFRVTSSIQFLGVLNAGEGDNKHLGV